MALTALVYCDCFERGRLRTPPPGRAKLCIGSDGALERAESSGRLEDDLAFDHWKFEAACSHENGILLHHRLGNIALVGLLREELSTAETSFPRLLGQVIYSGTHCGDFIPVSELSALRREIDLLATFQCRDRNSIEYVREFARQMRELVETAVTVGKPISF